MMGFKDFMDDEELQEGRLIRKGLGLLYSRQSKSYGDKSVQHFNRVKQELSKPVPDGIWINDWTILKRGSSNYPKGWFNFVIRSVPL